MIGNSSSEIIEAPSFGVSTVNIGNKQAKSLLKAMSDEFVKSNKGVKRNFMILRCSVNGQ